MYQVFSSKGNKVATYARLETARAKMQEIGGPAFIQYDAEARAKLEQEQAEESADEPHSRGRG